MCGFRKDLQKRSVISNYITLSILTSFLLHQPVSLPPPWWTMLKFPKIHREEVRMEGTKEASGGIGARIHQYFLWEVSTLDASWLVQGSKYHTFTLNTVFFPLVFLTEFSDTLNSFLWGNVTVAECLAIFWYQKVFHYHHLTLLRLIKWRTSHVLYFYCPCISSLLVSFNSSLGGAEMQGHVVG